MTRVLVVGGYGVVGTWIARLLRAAHEDLQLVIAGRNPAAGQELAAGLGASVVELDVADPQAGLAQVGPLDLVIGSVRDPDDNLALAALKAGAAYTTIVRGTDTLGGLAIAASLAGRAALVQGYWQAGVMTLCALAAGQAFDRIDRIELAALYDTADPVGPMTATDSAGFFDGVLVRRARRWVRVEPSSDVRTVSRGVAAPFDARPMSALDVPGLAAATAAPDIRFDLGIGPSLGVLSGAGASHDIYIGLWGQGRGGQPLSQLILVSDPKGQAHLTALGVLIGAERLLGLDGRPPQGAGIAFPEVAIDPDYAVRRLRRFGVSFEPAPQ